jgi:hypothetical protein
MTLEGLHNLLSTSVTLYTLFIVLWTLAKYLRKQTTGGDYLGAIATGEILIVAQAIVGGILWFSDLRPGRSEIHLLYGAVALLTWPAAYAFTRRQEGRNETFIWLLVNLFLFFISFRARVTGL